MKLSTALTLLSFTAFSGLAMAPASAQTAMKECGTKYEAAKAANALNGMSWSAFYSKCAADMKAAPAAAAAPAAPAVAAPAKPVVAAPAAAVLAKPAAAAPMAATDKEAISKKCSSDADAKGLHGKDRKKFREECKSAAKKM